MNKNTQNKEPTKIFDLKDGSNELKVFQRVIENKTVNTSIPKEDSKYWENEIKNMSDAQFYKIAIGKNIGMTTTVALNDKTKGAMVITIDNPIEIDLSKVTK